MGDFDNFKDKTIREIRIWAWLAAVLPLTALAGLFFTWVFGLDSLFQQAMVIGETTMFGIAVFWWWWAMHVMYRLVTHWGQAGKNIQTVLNEVKGIKTLVSESVLHSSDK